MKILIISVGKAGKEYALLLDHWRKMINLNLIEKVLNQSALPTPDLVKKAEATQIIKAIPKNSAVIVLDPGGTEMDSKEFARCVNNSILTGKGVVFIIGGAYGLDKEVLSAAQSIVSLSKLTMPHLLAKLVLMEQIYRAQTIINGHPYHK